MISLNCDKCYIVHIFKCFKIIEKHSYSSHYSGKILWWKTVDYCYKRWRGSNQMNTREKFFSIKTFNFSIMNKSGIYHRMCWKLIGYKVAAAEIEAVWGHSIKSLFARQQKLNILCSGCGVIELYFSFIFFGHSVAYGIPGPPWHIIFVM